MQGKVQRVAAILKERFPNLTVAEVIELAFRLIDAVEKLEVE